MEDRERVVCVHCPDARPRRPRPERRLAKAAARRLAHVASYTYLLLSCLLFLFPFFYAVDNGRQREQRRQHFARASNDSLSAR